MKDAGDLATRSLSVLNALMAMALVLLLRTELETSFLDTLRARFQS